MGVIIAILKRRYQYLQRFRIRQVLSLNVLVLAQYFPPDLGGSATRAYNIAKGLSLNGCNVTVVTAFPHYPQGKIPAEYSCKVLRVEQLGKIRVIRTFMPGIKSEGILRRLLLMIAFTLSSLFALPFIGIIDTVWASSWAPGWVYSKVKRTPLVLNVDDMTLEDLIDLNFLEQNSIVLKIARAIYKVFLAKGDALTPVSKGYIPILKNTYWVPSERINLVLGGVDLTIFKPSVCKEQTGKKFVVLYSGSFSIAYNFEQIFKAAKLIETVDKDVEFVIQGGGEMLSQMRCLMSKLKVKNVSIVDKIISRSDVAELLGKADVLVLPLANFCRSGQPYRGMSSKLYEYQAVGKPIICCSRGIPSQYVVESNSGLIVTPGDAQELAGAVMRLRSNPNLAQDLGTNGRKYVEKEASLETVGMKIGNIAKKAMSQRDYPGNKKSRNMRA